ncbi:DUF4198 domain-containing protein [Catalinimonas niigatensis]|uniref:DUF4198 domain-containing protein n=1 Tax=Catalinimonas niigatensis TaxID=1397264 RepID=UPI002665F28A|nr:DUF4198 domain-containing protein [Catalinimonas niigatensis]WPP49732.1 DUF4198 domain-containing protein [Catalinimonas niigatensis]
MKKTFLLLTVFVLFSNHDMYLKLDAYFLQPDTPATIELFNGTFDKSENVITRDRMVDMSLVGNGKRSQVDSAQWSEKDSVTMLSFNTGEPGTWIAGISTAPRSIELPAADFNDYLEHDGVLDMLEWRQENDAMEVDAVERYSKHVKAIFQVGDKRTNDWQTALGYPIEFIPLTNPYDLHTGDELQVQLLLRGEPLANQLVYADYRTGEHGHSHDQEHTHGTESDHSHDGDAAADHQHTYGTQLRTDDKGNLTLSLSDDGIWYLRTIHLVHSEDPEFTHESNWATLTFEVSHEHGENTHTHDQESGIPTYAYWIGSLVLLGGMFFWFNRKK